MSKKRKPTISGMYKEALSTNPRWIEFTNSIAKLNIKFVNTAKPKKKIKK